jgi:3-phenylpropionate/trans-cinnamate dioxygenase ferredoxin component
VIPAARPPTCFEEPHKLASVAVSWIRVASIDELAAARRLVRTIAGIEILVLQLSGSVVAVRNACTHLGKPLAQGRIIAGRLHCPFHGACFDLDTGEAISGPAVAPLPRYDVKIDGAEVWVAVAHLPLDGDPNSIRVL